MFSKLRLGIIALVLLLSIGIAGATLKISRTHFGMVQHSVLSWPVRDSLHISKPSARNLWGLCSGVNFQKEVRTYGWPVPYNYEDQTEPGCQDAHYPLMFVFDVWFFAASLSAITVLLMTIKKYVART